MLGVAWAAMPEELVDYVLFLSVRTPRDLGGLRGVSRGFLALSRRVEYSLFFTGRQIVPARVAASVAPMRCARFWHSNLRSDELHCFAECFAARVVVASKCFGLGDAAARDLLVGHPSARLRALHVGDVLWMAPQSRPALDQLRLLGLTNGSVQAALLLAIGDGLLPALEAVFLGGCLIDDASAMSATLTSRRSVAVVETTFLEGAAVVAATLGAEWRVDFTTASVQDLERLRRVCAAAPELLAAALEAADGRKQAPDFCFIRRNLPSVIFITTSVGKMCP